MLGPYVLSDICFRTVDTSTNTKDRKVMGETQLDQMEKDRFNDSTNLMSKRTDLMASIDLNSKSLEMIDLNSKSVKVIDLNSKSIWTVNRWKW